MDKKHGEEESTILCDMVKAPLVADVPGVSPEPPTDELLHELREHQIELEMQNEELRRTQLALEESRDRYLYLYEFAPVGYFTLTDTGLITETNLTAAILLGLERKKLLQHRFDFFIHPEDRDRWCRLFTGLMQHASRERFDLRLTCGDGTLLHAHLDIWHHASDGKASGTHIMLTDITGYVRMEQSLALNEARLRGILNSAMDAIITVDEAQNIVFFNAAAESIFGWSCEQVTGAPLALLLPERFRTVHAHYIGQFGEAGSISRPMDGSRTIVALHRNGNEFMINASISQINENGAKFYTVILRDVTEQVMTENALHRSQEELRKLAAAAHSIREQEKRHIARELHDELGQSLTSLKMDVMWLMDRPTTDQITQVKKFEDMLSIIDGLTATTRRISSDLRPLMLDDLGLVPAAEWLVQNFMEHTGIRCELTIAMPERALQEPYATAMFRILQEALTNAARHAHATLIKIILAQTDGDIHLSVRDNGCGFITSTLRNQSYGLIGMRERIYLLDGAIKIDSEPGRGTTIDVRIPVPIIRPEASA
ncbi:MAG: PAS domain S-box protein [Pseudomonadota bacterium]